MLEEAKKLMKLPDYMQVVNTERTETGLTVTLRIKRGVGLWKALWRYAVTSYAIPVYRYPQLVYLVTKAWWTCG